VNTLHGHGDDGHATSTIRLCVGRVMHARSRPRENRFTYPVFCMQRRMDIQARASKQFFGLFGLNRRALLTLNDVDQGARDAAIAPMDWLRGRLDMAGVKMDIGEVWLQAFPRMMGFVFNPVSFWFVHDRAGALQVLLADVNNTFGERHQYVLVAPDGGDIGAHTVLMCRKSFHVSPFCEVKGHYAFRMHRTPTHCRVAIDYYDVGDSPPLLRTVIDCAVAPLTARALWAQVLKMPLLTLGVVARIHLQALRLWRLRVPFISKPHPPADDVSHNAKVEHELQ